MKQLIEDIAKALVDLPDQVSVHEVVVSRSRCWSYELRLATWESHRKTGQNRALHSTLLALPA